MSEVKDKVSDGSDDRDQQAEEVGNGRDEVTGIDSNIKRHVELTKGSSCPS